MQPQSVTPGVGEELASDAKNVASTAVNKLHSEIDVRKGDAATQAKSVSTAIQSAAGGLDESAPAWLKSALEQGTQQVQKFADTLEQKDSRQLVGQVSEFARTSPATFLGACAAAGFAAARIFKAGSTENTPSQPASIGGTSPYSTAEEPDSFSSTAGESPSFGSTADPAIRPQGQFV